MSTHDAFGKWVALALGLFAIEAASPTLAQEGQPRGAQERLESFERPGDRRVTGRLVGDAASGFRFLRKGSSAPVPLGPGDTVTFTGEEPNALVGLAPFRSLVGLDERLSGRLVRVDESTVTIQPLGGGKPVAIARGGVHALVQRAGEVQVIAEGFESLSESRWTRNGEPQIVTSPHLTGERSVRLPAAGAALAQRLADPIGAGRLELAYHDGGERAAEQRFVVELTFRGPAGPEPVRIMLGWDEASLAVQSPQGPALSIEHLVRKPGWHRLVVRFSPAQTEMAVDGDELANGNGPSGPLTEVRLVTQPQGKGESPGNLAAHVDDLRLVRLGEPAGSLEVDPSQDELRLANDDQLFGKLRAVDPEGVVFQVDGKDVSVGWGEASGIYFRRAPAQSALLSGLLVRVEWRSEASANPRDMDRLEGVLASLSENAAVLEAPYVGSVSLSRAQLRRLEVIGRTERVVLDPFAHHLGNEVFPSLDPPQPDGRLMDVPLALEKLPEGKAWLVLDVLQVAGEADNLPFAGLVKKGELHTNVALNGKRFDYLNRYIKTKNETPERIRIPIPAGLLAAGKNVIRIEQSGTTQDANYLDDLGVLCVAIEFEAPAAGASHPENPGP